MKIKAGSKLNKIIGYAMTQFKEDEIKQTVFSGFGNAVTKTVTCVEIMKRKYNSLHQITKIGSRRIEEMWEPKLEGLDSLKVVREIPCVHILLSKTPLDQNELGYQQGNTCNIFMKSTSSSSHQSKNRPSDIRGRTPSNRGKKRKKET